MNAALHGTIVLRRAWPLDGKINVAVAQDFDRDFHPAANPVNFAKAAFDIWPAEHHMPWVTKAIDRRITHLALLAPRESGKTIWLCTTLPLWWIGRYPLDTNFIGSVSDDQAKARLRAIKSMIDSTRLWKKVFPNIVPDYQRGWSTDSLHVKRDDMPYDKWMELVAKHGQLYTPTLLAGGVGAAGAVGNRFSGLLIFDDVHDDKNSSTETLRERVHGWMYNTVLNTATATALRRFVGTRWHPQDAASHLIESDVWEHIITHAIIDKDTPRERSYWPSQWPMERLKKKREEIGTPFFRAQYENDPRGLLGDVIDLAWFRDNPDRFPLPFRKVCVSVDLALSKEKYGSYTVITTAASDTPRNLYVLDVVRGQWSFAETMERIVMAAQRAVNIYGTVDKILVEQVAYQQAMVQELTRQWKFGVLGINPQTDKISRARPWVAMAERGEVFVSKDANWWGAFSEEAADFSPDAAKTDQIDTISQAHEFLIGGRAMKVSTTGIRLLEDYKKY